MKNLNFLLRPNSVLQSSSSPNSFIAQNISLNDDSEYPIPSNIESRLQHRPLNQSRSNSKLRGLQKSNRPYSSSKKHPCGRKSSVPYSRMYSKDYPDSILQESGSTRLQLEIPYKQANPVPKRGRARKHIRITEQ